MKAETNRITIYIVVIAIFFLILFLSVSAPIVVNDSEYSIYNPGWDGCSDLAVKTREMGNFAPNIELVEGKRTEVVQRDLYEYEIEPQDTGLMIIGPEQEFSGESIDFVDDFLQEGGRMVLADDFGSGNTLLDGLDTDSSFHSTPLLDLSFEGKPEFGVAYNTSEHDMTDGVSQVMLNSPTAVEKDANATTLMRSSEASWLDEDGDGIKDADEEFSEYPLITVEEYGEGELILVSDPGIFINSMQERKDNRILSENILEYLSEERSDIIFDESHRDMSFLYRIIYTGDVPNNFIGAILLAIGAGFGIHSTLSNDTGSSLKKISESISRLIDRDKREKDPVGKVLNNHPDWDKDKLEMIHERLPEEN